MKRKRYTEPQIVFALQRAVEGTTVAMLSSMGRCLAAPRAAGTPGTGNHDGQCEIRSIRYLCPLPRICRGM